MSKQTLQQIFAEIGHFGNDIGCNDKGSTHTYLETFEKLFEPFRKKSTILEIGLALGDSIKLWDRYFEDSNIVGADISVVFQVASLPILQNGNRIEIIEADATKPEFLEKIKDYKFDLVVEDSSHMEADSIAIFNLLKPKMKPGSVYIIEDVLSIDLSEPRLKALHDNCEIIDMRHLNNRFDNVLAVYRFF